MRCGEMHASGEDAISTSASTSLNEMGRTASLRLPLSSIVDPSDQEPNLEQIIQLIELHHQNSAQCRDEDTVFILGNTGAGKSTTLNYLAGRKIVTFRDADNNFCERIQVEDPLEGCTVGHTGDSETRYLRSYFDRSSPNGHLVLCDTPGFEDTEGSNIDIANSVAIAWAIRQCKSVRLVLIIEASTILNTRGVELKRLLSLCQRFLVNLEDNIDSVLPLITHCQDTSAVKLQAALNRFMNASHFVGTRCILQRTLQLLQSQAEQVMVRPADERGAELQPQVKALVHSIKPILNPRQVLRSPLSDTSLSDLVLRCKELANSMESRFRRGVPIRELKDDMDNLRLLSDTLDLLEVTQSYRDICNLLVEHVCEACRLARVSFERGDFVETRHNFNRLEGLESMEQHVAVISSELRTREYVPLFVELNQTVHRRSEEVRNAGTPFDSIKGHLDYLLGIDRALKEMLDSKLRDMYRYAVQTVEARFRNAFDEAKRRISAAHLCSTELDVLLGQLKQMPEFQEHFDISAYYEDCIQMLQTRLHATYVFVTQHLENPMQSSTVPEVKAGLQLLCDACNLQDCHAPEAQGQSSECLRLFNFKCNCMFASVDSGMTNQIHHEVDDSLGQLTLLLTVQDDVELERRYRDKVNDITKRLEADVSTIRGILGEEETPRDQDYRNAIAKFHMFSAALQRLSKYLAPEAAIQFEDERDHIIREFAALHERVFEIAMSSLGLGNICEPQGQEEPRELVKSLAQIESMLETRLEFENRLWSHRDDFRNNLLHFFSTKCNWCIEHAKVVDDVAGVDDIAAQMDLVTAYLEELKKLSGRGETLSNFFLGTLPEVSKQSHDASLMSGARTVSKRGRNVVSAVSLGLGLVRGILNFQGADLTSSHQADMSRDVVEPALSDTNMTGSLCSMEELESLLDKTLAQSVDNLSLRASELEAICSEHQRTADFEEMKRVLTILSSFARLESITKTKLTVRYTSAVSSARNMLASESDKFDSLVRAEEMEQALKVVNTVRSMLVLKDDVPVVEEVYRRLNCAFQEKTGKFNSMMNELLESKNFPKMARLLKGHSQLEFAMPAARHEFDSARQQLAEFFKVRFESGWSSLQSIVPTKRLADHKLNELREVIKDFTDARAVFEVFGTQNQFTEWDESLMRTLRGKAFSIAQHAATCTRNLDFRGYDGCAGYLESLQIISQLADDLGQYMADMETAMKKRIEALESELLGAIERIEARNVDKIFNGLKRGAEILEIAGMKLDEEYERLQTILEHHLKDLCAQIQRSLDAYEIREAHENLNKFRSLLVSEAVKGTEYNGDIMGKFLSEMDEIKQEILTPRLLTEDPEKISRCLEGFKEVDSRFYKRQRDRFLDNLKAEVDSCGKEVARREVRNLKGLEQRMKELKFYERALKGQGCDREIETYKRELFESLTETILQVHEDIDFKVSKSKWDDVDNLKKFLEKAYPILQSSELTSEAEKRTFMERFDKVNHKIQAKANGITSKLELIESFDLKNSTSISPEDLSEFLSDLEREGQLLDGKLVQNFASQDISKDKIVRELKARIQVASKDVQSLWEAKDYQKIYEVVHRLTGLCQIEALAPETERILILVQDDLKSRLDELVRKCLESFRQALHHGTRESKDTVRRYFQSTNAYLEEIQKCQKHFGAASHIGAENREDTVVKVMMEATNELLTRFQRLASSSHGAQMEDVVSAVLNLWTVPSEISNHRVKAHAKAKIAEIFDICRENGKKRKADFNFGELAVKLSGADARGGEIVDQFSETFRAYHSMKFRQATARMTMDDALDKLAKLNSLTDDQKEALRQSYAAFHSRFRNLLENTYSLQHLPPLVPLRESSTSVKLEDLPGMLATIFAAWSMSLSSKATDTSTWPSPHPVQVLSILRLLGIGAPKSAKKGFLLQVLSKVGDYFKTRDPKAKTGRGHLIELKTGEGKSIVLGALATVLAILGFRVDCVCYSQYLSTRDWSAFEQIFELFGVQDRVKYDTFTSLSKRLINSVCDVREGTKSFVDGEVRSVAGSGGDVGRKILLIDEVDVFFSQDFYGAVYAASSLFMDPQVEVLQRLIWQHRAQPTRDIVDRVKKHEAYGKLVKLCANVVPLIDRHLGCMAEDVKLFDSKDHVYQVDKEGRIAYKTHDTMSSNIVCRYRTLFAYFKELERGAVTEASLKAAMGLHINCGNFSYAEIPHYYDQILGVTGTLESLGTFEKGVIQSVYGIRDKTLTPSIYGDSQLTFREVSDVHVEPDVAQYNRKLKEEILTATGQDRAVLVFFEDERRLHDWMKSGYAEGIDNLCHVTSHTENIDHYVKQATRARTVTLFTAVHGRGLDFVCHDKAVEAAGGVHVVQAFLSEQLSEEIQIKGRTARQDKKGTFKLVVLASDLTRFGVTAAELEEARRASGVYPLLHAKRSAWFAEESARRAKDVESAREWHTRSVAFQRHLLDYAAPGRDGTVSHKIRDALLEFQAHVARGGGGGGVCRLMCLSDATGSMEALWDSSKKHIQTMLRRIEELAGAGRVELKWVAFRDYDQPAASLVQCSAWTKDASALLSFLDGVRCFGGGDFEEAIEAALALANRDEVAPTRVLLIGDAPPHSEKAGEKLGEHSHVLETDWAKECEELARKGVPVYTFQVGSDKATASVFAAMAKATGGEARALSSADDLLDVVCMQALEQVGGAALVDEYRAKYMAFTYAS